MYPSSTMQNEHRDAIGRSNGHGLTQVLRQDIWDGGLSRRILPLNIEAQQKNMTWTKTMQWDYDLRRVTQRSERKLKGLAQCRGSVDYDTCR
jgi:hypothetical protein